jgi:hypothetical protein
MTDFAIDVSGVRAVSCRLVMPWRGAWFADIDIDPDSAPVTEADIPTGQVTVTLTPNAAGATPIVLTGTVDPLASGRFVSTVRVRVLAGGGGWGNQVPGQHWNSPEGGVSAQTVEEATAGLVGETIHDPSPVSLGFDWVRTQGPASAIFADRPWYVDLTGVTQVGTWPTAQPDATLEIREWDPLTQKGMVSVDALVMPGTVLTDPRFDGPVTVRDVEQIWDAKGTRATVWCSANQVTRLIEAIKNVVRLFGKLAPLKIYKYRVIQQNGATLNLQAVNNADGSQPVVPPELQNVVVWPGLEGLSCQYKLGSLVLVAFIAQPDGSSGPFVLANDPSALPLTSTLDASGQVNVGPSAGTVALAGGGPGVARLGDTVLVYFPPSMPISGTVSGAPFVGLLTIPGPGIGSIQTASNKANSGFIAAPFALLMGAVAALLLWLLSFVQRWRP